MKYILRSVHGRVRSSDTFKDLYENILFQVGLASVERRGIGKVFFFGSLNRKVSGIPFNAQQIDGEFEAYGRDRSSKKFYKPYNLEIGKNLMVC